MEGDRKGERRDGGTEEGEKEREREREKCVRPIDWQGRCLEYNWP